jgi:putative transcriptional regulator
MTGFWLRLSGPIKEDKRVKTYKSKTMAALHENVSDLYRVGMIDKKTMRKFDSTCLAPVRKLSPATIRRIRAKADVSQAVLPLI